MPNDSTLP